MAKQYTTNGFANDPLHTNSDGTPSSLLGLFDDSLGAFLFGGPDASSQIFGELTGYNSQQREFEQQEYMTDKQNQWNSAQEQMKRAKEAGINPLTAAGAIAGNGSSSAASPEPSSAGAAAGGLNAISGFANAITGGKASLAKAALDKSTKKEVETLLPEKLKELRNNANLKFEEVGLTHSQSVLAAASAEYADENALRDIQMKRVRVQQMSQEYKNLKAVHEQILEDINLKISQAQLNGSQKDYYDSLKLKTDEETRWIKADNDFWELNGFDRHANSNDLIISQMIANGQDPDAYIQSWIDYHGQYQGVVSRAEADAKNSSDVLFGRIGSPQDLAGRIASLGTKLITDAVGDVSSWFKGLSSARSIRSELNKVLDNAFEQLDKYPDDASRIQPIIDDIQAALRLSNKELKKWYDSNWK